MGKIDTLQKYIDACDEIKSHSENEKDKLIDEIVNVYNNEIKNIHRGLDMYQWMSDGRRIDYDGDIIKIKAKLINYKDNLELEEQKRKDELELARLGQNNINLSANANNSNNINISITLEQAIKNIEQIPEEIEKLKKIICLLEEFTSSPYGPPYICSETPRKATGHGRGNGLNTLRTFFNSSPVWQ